MRPLRLFFPLVLAGCLSPWRAGERELAARLADLPAFREPPPPVSLATPAADLEAAVSLEALVAEARARNPELREAAARVRAALEEVAARGALDDPAFKYEAWAVPLRRPAAFDQADTHMLGLMQSFPLPGNLGLRAKSALREAEALHQAYRARERDLVAELKKTYFEYFFQWREIEIHREHVAILEEFEKITEARFRTGAGTQADVLKAQIELLRLHNDVLAIEQRLGSARAAINRLLGRPASMPLGRPEEVAPHEESPGAEDVRRLALEARPELQAALLRRQASEAALELAEREALFPELTLGVDYWLEPARDDRWGGTVSVNLPWLSGRRAAEARRLAQVLRADRLAVEAAGNQVLFEVEDALLRLEAARRSLELYEGELLPKSRQAVEATRAGYERDRASFLDLLDAERTLRDAQIDYYKSAAEHESALAELERAAGTDLRRKP
jgi:cobalt-zinc-cadmium efflux system outer membrane protein